MLDDYYHNKVPNMDSDWTHDSFAPVPAFVDTGSVLIDKNNVEAFRQTNKTMTGASK